MTVHLVISLTLAAPIHRPKHPEPLYKLIVTLLGYQAGHASIATAFTDYDDAVRWISQQSDPTQYVTRAIEVQNGIDET